MPSGPAKYGAGIDLASLAILWLREREDANLIPCACVGVEAAQDPDSGRIIWGFPLMPQIPKLDGIHECAN